MVNAPSRSNSPAEDFIQNVENWSDAPGNCGRAAFGNSRLMGEVVAELANHALEIGHTGGMNIQTEQPKPALTVSEELLESKRQQLDRKQNPDVYR